jgi:hypothetical protein
MALADWVGKSSAVIQQHVARAWELQRKVGK